MEKDFLTITEAAKILSVSRVTVFQRIKKGQIKAIRIGNIYAIPKEEIEVKETILSPKNKKLIDKAVEKTVKEYGETLRMLGKE